MLWQAQRLVSGRACRCSLHLSDVRTQLLTLQEVARKIFEKGLEVPEFATTPEFVVAYATFLCGEFTPREGPGRKVAGSTIL